MCSAQGNVGLAFGLVIAAGACTCLGALLVFCCTNLANTKWLSGSLGASAGVMIFISMFEILSTKAVQGFKDAGYSESAAQRYACFAFFGGLLATWLLGKLVDLVVAAARAWDSYKARNAAASLDDLLPTHKPGNGPTASSITTASGGNTTKHPSSQDCHPTADPEVGLKVAHPEGGCCKDTMAIPDTASTTPRDTTAAAKATAGATSSSNSSGAYGGSCGAARCQGGEGGDGGAVGSCCCSCSCATVAPVDGVHTAMVQGADPGLLAALSGDSKQHGPELARMGALTALAVGLHNLPEGLATFAAALASPSTGVVIAIAIALHNIPEGVAVALPLYYATGSRWKGLMWAAISGAAEPIGGLLGYAVLCSTGMSQLAFGIMFAFVAGMMVYISIRELLPTALRYDPKDSCATACAFWGMAVMASSLLLFRAQG